MFAFPALLIAMILAADFGGSTLTAMIAIGVAYVPIFARVTRGAALQVLNTEYILAARASGESAAVILRRHVLPNIISTVIVQMTLLFSLAVLAEAALTYLGLGTPPPTPSWGHMLQTAQNYLYNDPLLTVWPGLMIAVTVLGFNLLGDGLREVLDPRGVRNQ
jgi:peptide/nickel transport system permease protein